MTAAPVLTWPVAATGVGSWPGTDPFAAAEVIIGELETLPYLPELPARGIGADVIGRCAAVLVDIELDTSTTGYRLTARPGSVRRRARDLLARDLDAFEELWETSGRRSSAADTVFKLQFAGPWTLAARVEVTGGHRAITDRGAVDDIAASLAEGIAEQCAQVRKRFNVTPIVQLDEPSLPAVLAGSLGAVSILDSVAPIRRPRAIEILDAVIERVGHPVVLYCSPRVGAGSSTDAAHPVPYGLLAETAAEALGFDATSLSARDLDGVAEALDRGRRLVLGVVPAVTPERTTGWRSVVRPALDLVDRAGFPRSVLRTGVDIAPTGGLAEASDSWARRATALSVEAARALADEPEALE